MSSKSTGKCMFDHVIDIICFGNSHMDENMDINTFYMNNWFIKRMYLNLESLFALNIAVSMTLLCIFIRLYESFIRQIVGDDWYNYYQSYYKIIYCYLFVLTMRIEMIGLIIMEPIVFAQEYLHIINDKNNLHTDKTDSTIDKKMDLYDDCRLISGNLIYCIDSNYSSYIIYQLVYSLYPSNIFIIAHFFIIMIVLLAYTLILNYIYTKTMQDKSYTNNFTVLIIMSIVWFLIAIMSFQLTLLMVVLYTVLIYHAIGIINDYYHYDQDSNTNVQDKIILGSI